MIQKRPASKKKTLVSLAIVIVMFGGMAWMLLGSSSPSPDSFIPAEGGGSVATVPTNARLDSNLFQDPLFAALVQQSGILPIDPTRIGRANPFVPVVVKNVK